MTLPPSDSQIVQQIGAIFGGIVPLMIGNVIRKIFGYRDIADWSRKKNGTHFSQWPPKIFEPVKN